MAQLDSSWVVRHQDQYQAMERNCPFRREELSVNTDGVEGHKCGVRQEGCITGWSQSQGRGRNKQGSWPESRQALRIVNDLNKVKSWAKILFKVEHIRTHLAREPEESCELPKGQGWVKRNSLRTQEKANRAYTPPEQTGGQAVSDTEGRLKVCPKDHTRLGWQNRTLPTTDYQHCGTENRVTVEFSFPMSKNILILGMAIYMSSFQRVVQGCGPMVLGVFMPFSWGPQSQNYFHSTTKTFGLFQSHFLKSVQWSFPVISALYWARQ